MFGKLHCAVEFKILAFPITLSIFVISNSNFNTNVKKYAAIYFYIERKYSNGRTFIVCDPLCSSGVSIFLKIHFRRKWQMVLSLKYFPRDKVETLCVVYTALIFLKFIFKTQRTFARIFSVFLFCYLRTCKYFPVFRAAFLFSWYFPWCCWWFFFGFLWIPFFVDISSDFQLNALQYFVIPRGE